MYLVSNVTKNNLLDIIPYFLKKFLFKYNFFNWFCMKVTFNATLQFAEEKNLMGILIT